MLDLHLKFLCYGPSCTHCCRALTFAFVMFSLCTVITGKSGLLTKVGLLHNVADYGGFNVGSESWRVSIESATSCHRSPMVLACETCGRPVVLCYL